MIPRSIKPFAFSMLAFALPALCGSMLVACSRQSDDGPEETVRESKQPAYGSRLAALRASLRVSGERGGRIALREHGDELLVVWAHAEESAVRIASMRGESPSWPEAARAALPAVWPTDHFDFVVHGDEVNACYTEGPGSFLRCSRSTDGGRSWRARETHTLDDDTLSGRHVSIGRRGRDVFVAHSNPRGNDVRFARSRDGGRIWPERDRKILDASATSKGGRYPTLAMTPNRLLVAYNGAYNKKDDGQSLRLAASDDWGDTWTVKNIDGPSCSLGMHASMSAAGEHVGVAYRNRSELRFMLSADEGRTFDLEGMVIVEEAQRNRAISSMSLHLDPPHAYIAYIDMRAVKLARSGDLGRTWSIHEVGSSGVELAPGTSLAVDGDRLIVAYAERSTNEPRMSMSTDGGRTWARVR